MNLRVGYRGALLCAAAIVTALALFTQPEVCRLAAQQGLQLCGGPLLIGIFPFLIVSDLIVGSGCAGLLARPFCPAARLLGCHSDAGAAILLMGAVGGFAPVAATAAGLCRKREVAPDEASLLLAAAAGSSPAFVVLTVGQQMLGSRPLGVRLYLCQTAAAYLAVLCLRFIRTIYRRKPDNVAEVLSPMSVTQNTEFAQSVAGAVNNAALTYLKLCGFVVYFRILARCAATLLPEKAAALPAMLLEVSSGCSAAAERPVDAVYWCCAALSLQGASVLLQMRAICPPQLSLMPLIWVRPLHLGFSLLILRGMLQNQTAAAVLNSLETRVVTLPRLSPACALLLFGLCLLMCEQLCRTLQATEK